MRGLLLTLCGLVVLLGSGCGKSPPPIVPVQGQLLVGGKPLPMAEIRFYPMIDFGGEYIAVGQTDAEGRFTLLCNGQPGACACENRVTVTEGSVPDDMRGASLAAQAKQAEYQKSLKNRPIPSQYANLAQSPLAITVTAEQSEYTIELQR